jgi:hypothetical protein
MRFVVGINDDYIEPSFSADGIGEAVDYARSRAEDPNVWKVDIEARNRFEDTLLVMVVYEDEGE